MTLVNAHTHLELSWAKQFCPKTPVSFTHWLGRLVRRNQQARHLDNYEQMVLGGIEQSIATLHQLGITHIGDITQTGLSIEPLLASGLAGVVYVEVIGLEEGIAEYLFRRAVQWLEEYRPREGAMRLGLSAHAPYSTPAAMFQEITAYCIKEDVPLCIHLAESAAEVEALHRGQGPLVNLAQQLGGTQAAPFPGRRPVEYLAELGVLEAKPLLVHMVHVTDEELDLVAQAGAKIVHCPRSNQLLECGRMPLEKMLARHIPVALGTDSLVSTPSLDVREEALAAQELHQAVVEAEKIATLLSQKNIFTRD